MSPGATHLATARWWKALALALIAPVLGGCSLLLDFDAEPPTYPAAECAFGEPNDLPEEATPLSAEPVAAALCRPDVDFYALTVPAGQSITQLSLQLTQQGSQGNLDLYLYDAAGRELDAAVSASGDELLACPSITCGTLLPGAYVVEVRESSSSFVGNRYRLELTTQ